MLDIVPCARLYSKYMRLLEHLHFIAIAIALVIVFLSWIFLKDEARYHALPYKVMGRHQVCVAYFVVLLKP